MLINNNIIILFYFIMVKSAFPTRVSKVRPSGVLWKFFASSIV